MPSRIGTYFDKNELYVGKAFMLGQVYWIKDILVSIPDADRLKDSRKEHAFRAVAIISNNSENSNKYSPTILIAPLSHRIDLKRKFDVELFCLIDNTPQDCLVRMQLMQPVCKADLGKYICTVSDQKQAEFVDAYLEMIGQ